MTLLSEVIAELNDRFGLGLGTSDEILAYQQVVGLEAYSAILSGGSSPQLNRGLTRSTGAS